jgi:hypothetical protein
LSLAGKTCTCKGNPLPRRSAAREGTNLFSAVKRRRGDEKCQIADILKKWYKYYKRAIIMMALFCAQRWSP